MGMLWRCPLNISGPPRMSWSFSKDGGNWNLTRHLLDVSECDVIKSSADLVLFNAKSADLMHNALRPTFPRTF
jgi:hypothetical protein